MAPLRDELLLRRSPDFPNGGTFGMPASSQALGPIRARWDDERAVADAGPLPTGTLIVPTQFKECVIEMNIGAGDNRSPPPC